MTYRLKSFLFRTTELQTLVYKNVEVTLADVSGNLGPEFSWNDRTLHGRAL